MDICNSLVSSLKVIVPECISQYEFQLIQSTSKMGHIPGRGEEEKAPSELTSLGLSPLPDTCAHVHGLINELSL